MGDLYEEALRHFVFGPFLLMPERQVLLRNGTPVRLGGRALDILTLLVERPGELISKRELFTRVWPSTVVDESNLKVNMSSLRRVLGETADASPYIATVSGRGYRFVASVEIRFTAAHSVEAKTALPRSHNLPNATSRIFGRAEEIDTIRADMSRSRLLSVVGAGGIGKTTVAIAIAEYSIGIMKDGVWLIDFATSKNLAMALATMATMLAIQPHSSAVLDEICDHLRDREMLLVFDNCDHLIEATATIADRILSDAGGVSILATSREPLGVRGERVRRLRGLGVPPVSSGLKADEALTFPAIQLFVERATERLEWFELNDDNAPTAADICRRLDGLALAIELAASHIDTLGISGLLKQLDYRFRLLTGRRAGPERQRTLTATLDWSYSMLTDDEAALLCTLCVFAGAFSVEDASVVADIAPVEVENKLALLAAKSLLATDLESQTITYRLLETTRAYCLGRLQEAGRLNPAQRHHS